MITFGWIYITNQPILIGAFLFFLITLAIAKRIIPFTLARCICTIVENTEAKMKHLENLKMILSKNQYPKQLTEFGINRPLSIPLQELRTPKTISNDNSLLIITTYNPSNPNAYEVIDKSVECLKRNKVDGFENLRVIKSKWQVSNLKKILTKAEFSQKQVRVFKCPDKRCECCASLLLGIHTHLKMLIKHSV